MLKFSRIFAALLCCGLARADGLSGSVTPQIGGGIGGSFDGGVSTPTGFLPQAQQFFARAPGLTPTQKTKYNTMIGTMLSCPNNAGNAYALLDVLHVYDAPTSAIALTNIISASYTGVVHGTVTFTANQGFAGDQATGYIDTQFIPSSAGGNYTLNGGMFGVYTRSSSTAASVMQMGTNIGSANFSAIGPNWEATLASTAMFNNNNFNETSIPTNHRGFWIVTGTANTENLYINGAFQVSWASAPAGLDTSSFLVGGAWNNGSLFAPSPDQNSAAVIGGFLTATQVTCVSNAINTFLAADGNNVYAATSNLPALSSASLSSIFSGKAGSALPLLGINTHTATTVGGQTITPAMNTSLALQLGASVVRIDATNWANVEQSAGVYTYTVPDTYLTGASGLRTAGLTVQLLLGYSNLLYEATLFIGPTDATGKTAFGNYGGGAAANGVLQHYGATGYIAEVWNEPNIGCGSNFWAPAANATDYSTLATGAAAAITAKVASAVLITGGLAPTSCGIAPNTFGGTMNSALTWTHFAGAGLHPYNSGDVNGSIPEQLITDTASFAAVVTNASSIYISEVGYSTDGTSGSQTKKGIYDARLLASCIIAQVKECLLYDLISDGTSTSDHESNFGLFPNSCVTGGDCSPLPAGTAFINVAAALAGCATADAGQIAASTLWQITCHRTALTRIVWTSRGAWRYTSAEGGTHTGTAIDVLGNVIAVTADGAGNLSFNVIDTIGPVILTVNYLMRRDVISHGDNDNRPIGIDVAA